MGEHEKRSTTTREETDDGVAHYGPKRRRERVDGGQVEGVRQHRRGTVDGCDERLGGREPRRVATQQNEMTPSGVARILDGDRSPETSARPGDNDECAHDRDGSWLRARGR